MRVRIRRLRPREDLPLPTYESNGAAGMDLRACLDQVITIPPGRTALIPTGLAVAVPPGYEAQIRPRSGLALRHAVSLPNTPGTIDSDYRGEIQVILINHGTEAFTVEDGQRIAQMVFAPVIRVVWDPVDTLSETERGEGGFGSTGR